MLALQEQLLQILKEKEQKITPENIKEGVQIFNVVGEHSGGTSDTSDATATAEDIAIGKTAYVDGEKIVGTKETSASEYNAKMIDINNQWVTTFAFKEIISKLDFTNVDFKSINKFTSAFAEFQYLTEIKGFNPQNATTLNGMCYRCYELHTINEIDTSKLVNGTSLTSAFESCPKLSDESLNNILAMCTKAVKITSSEYKTLKNVGLSSDQATVCQGLSNYEAFIAAGWTTGY